MLTKDYISKFYEDVEKLGLKYPVARIAEALGESKGNVSKILNKKMEPSESFLKKFYESFKNVSRATLVDGETNEVIGSKVIIDSNVFERLLEEKEARRKETEEALKREIESLKLEKERTDFLLNVMKDNLGVIATNSSQTLLYLETILRHDRSAHQVGLANQDLQLHQAPGTSSTKADNLELAAAGHHPKKGRKNQDGVGKKRTGA